MYTAAIEDYVKAIYKLQSAGEAVSTTALARRMGASAAAATKMLKQLDALKLVDYTPYHGVQLSPVGQKVALEIIRHHRLIELYLVQAMGYTWDQVDAEAEKLEHVISEEFEAKLDALLGYPTVCPHGDPIPSMDGTLNETRLQTLADQLPGDTVVIVRVKDTESDVLRALTAREMCLHSQITIVARDRIDGLLTIHVGGHEHIVGPALAGSVFVAPVPIDAAGAPNLESSSIG